MQISNLIRRNMAKLDITFLCCSNGKIYIKDKVRMNFAERRTGGNTEDTRINRQTKLPF